MRTLRKPDVVDELQRVVLWFEMLGHALLRKAWSHSGAVTVCFKQSWLNYRRCHAVVGCKGSPWL